MDAKLLQQGELVLSGDRRMRSRWVTASIVLHLSVFGILLYHRQPQLIPDRLPGELSGHHLLLTYSPGDSAPPSTLKTPQKPANKAVMPRPIPAPVPAPVTPSAATPSTSTGASTGADALGQGDTTLALVVVHPSPKPDLSQLPSGTRGDVVVDVVIDQNGRIAKSSLARGLGHGIDEAVLATIQQWTFQPATRNGVPVASEQELLFHYEHA
jgi:periplasmic protein TonB